jgi:beta-glucosidase
MRHALLPMLFLLLPSALPAAPAANDPDARAAAVVAQMNPEELTQLTVGIMPLPAFDPRPSPPPLPADAVIGAGYVPGVPRLQIPSLRESDASLGVAWVLGMRHDGATALPSALAMGATWNLALMRQGGATIGGEARAKGFNVLLAGGMNLMRDPRNGRSFEYLGEDPLHSGLMSGAAVNGIQSMHVISTVKHFAFNGQETGRKVASSNIGDAAARESDLLAFQIAIEQSQPGAVMCAYNKVNQVYSCGNDYLLNKVLKGAWAYKGWVMSDWGAVHGLADALNGLDQQSGSQLDPAVYFGTTLAAAATHDGAYAQRLRDMNQRVLRSIYAVGVDQPTAPPVVDPQANAAVAQTLASEGIVLLRNRLHALPLSSNIGRIALIGGFADSGMLSGSGSSAVQSADGPSISVPLTNNGKYANFITQAYHRSVPLKAIQARVPGARVDYNDGRYLSDAAHLARAADVAIVFATEWRSEGYDVPDLRLPDRQDALIAAVAAANPNTIVVLETGGPVLMPWLEQTAAVIEAWYPGARGAEALAAILFGDVNPSGKLPVTFPASLVQLPRPALPGAEVVEPSIVDEPPAGTVIDVDYDIEGSDVGYRWYARRGEQPLFPFGFGLSYTTYAYSDLRSSGGNAPTARLAVRNSGAAAGQETAQLYLVRGPQGERLRLLGWAKLELKPGEQQIAAITIDRRLLADFDSQAQRWHLAAGDYTLAAGPSSAELPLRLTLKLGDARFGR